MKSKTLKIARRLITKKGLLFVVLFVAAVSGVFVWLSGDKPHTAKAATTVYRAFSDNSYWNTPMPDNAPIDSHSAAWIADAQKNSGSGLRLTVSGGYGQNVYWSTASDPLYTLPGPHGNVQVHIPSGAQAGTGNDSQFVVFDRSSLNRVVGLHHASFSGGKWTVGDPVDVYSLTSNGMDQGAGADDPLNGGHRGINGAVRAYRLDELQAGAVEHRVECFWYDTNGSAPIYYPMTGHESRHTGLVPEGPVLRIKPSVNVANLGLSKDGETIARQLQKYGCVVGDTSGGDSTIKVQINGPNVPSVDTIRSIPWGDYEFVQAGYHPPTSGGGGGGGGGGTTDTQAPTTSITSPADGATISGTTSLSVNASDDTGVTKVELYSNGQLLKTDTSSPYNFSVDTTSLTAGSHSFYTKAYDAAGNIGQSATVHYTVQSTAPTCAVPNPPTTYGQVQQSVVIPAAGTYRVWSRIKAPDSTNNSYYFQVDGGCPINVGDGGSIAANNWTWVNYQDGSSAKYIDINLTQGTHQLVYTGRENDVLLDRILLLTDNTCVPTGTGDNCINQAASPTVNITAPTSGQTVSGTVPVSTDTNSVVTKVEFYLDGSLQATDTSAPFTWSWDTTGASNASHSLKAKAYDTNGTAVDSSTVTLTVDNSSSGGGGGGVDSQPPTTSITSPADGSTISGTTSITANASDDVGVTKVELYIDGVLSMTDTTAPYAFSVDTTGLSDGPHTFSTRAYDAASNVGQSAEVTYSKQAACTGASPSNTLGQVEQSVNVTMAGTYRVWSRMSVPDATANSYFLEVDGGCATVVGDSSTIPATNYTWVNYKDGDAAKPIDVTLTKGMHQLTMIGREGGVRLDRMLLLSDTSCVPTGTGDNCVVNTPDPAISIASPGNGETVNGTVNVTTNANSVVTKIDFYLDGTLVSTDTSSPFSWSWNTTTASNGTHSLVAKASDAGGTEVSSAAVSVNVNNNVGQGIPDLAITNVSWTPPTTTEGDNVTFKATIKNQGTAATPSGKTIRTEFKVDGQTVSWNDTTSPLQPGDTLDITANGGPNASATWMASGGTHTVAATVDSTSQVSESDESNNDLSTNMVVASTTATCDVDSITAPGLTLVNSSISAVTLSWTASIPDDGCTLGGYNVLRNGIKVATLDANTLGYTDNDVQAGKHYSYNISSFDTATNIHPSPLSNTINIVTTADDQAPTVPGGVTANASGSGSVNLQWTASTDLPQNGGSGVKGYLIYRNDDTMPTFTVTDPSATSFTDTSVQANTTYRYVITAIDNNQNESAPSNVATVTTPGASCNGTPTAPANLTSTDATISTISLSWTASTASGGCTIASYSVYRQGAIVGTVTSGTSFTDKDLTGNTGYTYKVVANDNGGHKSPDSNTITVATKADTEAPTAPGVVVATNVSPSQVRISWAASTDNDAVVGYRVYRDGTFLSTATDVTTVDTTVQADTDYSYAISAIDAAGNESAKVNATPSPIHTLKSTTDNTGPTAPTNLQAPIITATSVALTWDASSDDVGVAGYHIYINGLYDGDSTTTDFAEQCLAPSTNYVFQVRAFDDAANMSPPAELHVKTLDGAVAGDIDCDGIVGDSDLFTLLRFWNMPGLPRQGDVNGDGKVDSDDLFTLLRNWGKSS